MLTEALAAVIELLADRVAARVTAEQLVQPASPERSPWLTVKEAADYLRCKPKRIYDLKSQSRIPVHPDGGRPLFHRDELDAYLRGADPSLTPPRDLALQRRSHGDARMTSPVVEHG